MGHATWIVAAALATGCVECEAASASPDFAWLAGHWCSEQAGRRIDEVWLAGAAGSLHGLSRTLVAGKVESFEYMRIETEAGRVAFLAQPDGVAPTAFGLVDQGLQRASFANAAHDFPNRIDYRREGEQLHAQISGPGAEGGIIEIPFDYRRCD